MLEALIVYHLVKKNMEIVRARGRNPGGFIALTICLWAGFEFTGFIIGMILKQNRIICALIGLGLGGIGAVISYLISKNCREGDLKYEATAQTVSYDRDITVDGQESVPAGQTGKLCPFCGSMNGEYNKFCSSCGGKL